MPYTLFDKVVKSVKNILLYKPSLEQKPFVLAESRNDKQAVKPQADPTFKSDLAEVQATIDAARQLETLLDKARQTMAGDQEGRDLAQLRNEIIILKRQLGEVAPQLLANKAADAHRVSGILEHNISILKSRYNFPDNKDIAFRCLNIAGEKPKQCALVYLEGMVDKKVINLAILQPLMLFSQSLPSAANEDLIERLVEDYLPSHQVKRVTVFDEVARGINAGDSALFIDGLAEAVIIETKGYEHRSVGIPKIEQSVRGSQASFTETLRVNTGLIRTILPTCDLVTELIPVGDRVPLNCALMYLKSVANPNLVAEVKRRLEGISTDYISDSGILEQFIEDHPLIPFPQSLSTERPDRTAVHLLEGRVALLIDGIPFSHVLPATFFSFFQTIEDFSIKPPAGTFMRILRLFGTLLSVLLPASFLAISSFHQEAMPTDLALAIAGARERVPFPTLLEIIMMEFSFELIREAGLRVPGILGSTIGIVGAIILGQAAVAANLVSPIMVVIIAITGLASFSIPDYRMAFAFRLTRFMFLLLGAAVGLVGVAFGLAFMTALFASMKSFGVPYMAPIGPRTLPGFDVLVRGPVYRQELRPDELSPQDRQRQPFISRRWAIKRGRGKRDGL